MIDRSYLPYKAAREYQDRKMAKWLGFFLSEHTAALNDTGDTVVFGEQLSLDEKLVLLNQVYLNRLRANFVTSGGLITGEICDIHGDSIGIHGKGCFKSIKIGDIVSVALAEDYDNEPE